MTFKSLKRADFPKGWETDCCKEAKPVESAKVEAEPAKPVEPAKVEAKPKVKRKKLFKSED
jgi:hypothetical protein